MKEVVEFYRYIYIRGISSSHKSTHKGHCVWNIPLIVWYDHKNQWSVLIVYIDYNVYNSKKYYTVQKPIDS
jgi:hypothetical protein